MLYNAYKSIQSWLEFNRSFKNPHTVYSHMKVNIHMMSGLELLVINNSLYVEIKACLYYNPK